MTRSSWILCCLMALLLVGTTGVVSCRANDSTTGGVSAAAASLPQSVDLRPIFKSCGLAPRVQGERNTCSLFAVCGALEYAVASKQNAAVPLSVEFLNWAGNQTGKESPDGACFSELWKAVTAYGVCPETEMPYQEYFHSANKPSHLAIAQAEKVRQLGLRLHWIKQWDPNKGLTDRQLVEIKRTLARRWPVGGGFLWPKRRHARWDDGVLKMRPRGDVEDGHSVLLVGYRDDAREPGGGVFVIRNSSGPLRGGMLTYEYAKAYMNDAIWIDYAGANEGGPANAGVQSIAAETGGNVGLGLLARDPLGALTAPPIGRNRRVSSNEQPNWHDGNMDMTWLQPGESVEVPLLKGPGIITHMWFTSHAGWANELNALSIRIYWDGRKEPAVEAPLADFFAVGQGKPAVVESFPVQVSPTGALVCFWRMPFAKSARIVIRNDNPNRGTGLYWQIDWVEVDRLPDDVSYFHAKYRQEYPAKPGDYLIADLTGRGQYVGTVMCVTNAQAGWFGEGDDYFYIDGEEVPSLQGTGSEDYFNDAWGLRPRSSHWFGSPRAEGEEPGYSTACYRWHVLDPVGFNKSLRVAIEHKGNGEEDTEAFYLERPDFISSVAFWYQTGEPKPFGELPPWPDRCVPWQQHHMVRQFLHAKMTSGKLIVEAQGFFGSRPLLRWRNREVGAKLTLPFTIAEDGKYAIRLSAMQDPAYGLYTIFIDDKKMGEADFRGPEENELDLPLGVRKLAKGEHKLVFEAKSISPPGEPAKAKSMTVEALRLLKLPKKAVRKVKTDNEAHFVRLGLGRSLYAYRLVYGKLPDSLDEMVKVGIMPKKYLKDENDVPLRAWREGDSMVVQSVGPVHWKHRWTGLDPRR
ncbi:MAG: DUF2961 domain-containing protein [Thermoguttaceae bacterium]